MAIGGLIGAAVAVPSLAIAPLRAVGNVAGGFAETLGSAMKATAPKSAANVQSAHRIAAQRSLADEFQVTNSGKGVRLEDIEASAHRDLAAFSSRFRAALAERGIETEPSLNLSIDPASGRISVENNPDAEAQINALLEQEPELRNELNRITSKFDLVAAGKRATEFAKAYEANPVAAVAAYSSLLGDSNAPPIQMSVDLYEIRLR